MTAAANKPWQPDDSDLRPLGQSLDRVVRQLGPAAGILAVIKLWPEIVGEDIAEQCHPVRLQDGRLLVSAADSNWAAELRYNGAYVIERLAAELGAGVVDHLDIKVG